jgi:hypothetical protein
MDRERQERQHRTYRVAGDGRGAVTALIHGTILRAAENETRNGGPPIAVLLLRLVIVIVGQALGKLQICSDGVLIAGIFGDGTVVHVFSIVLGPGARGGAWYM